MNTETTEYDRPLIYTAHGNLPIDVLRGPIPEWNVSDEEISFAECWYLGDELVKRSAHVLKLKGVDLAIESGKVG